MAGSRNTQPSLYSIASQLATLADFYSPVTPKDDLTHYCLQDRFAQLSRLQRILTPASAAGVSAAGPFGGGLSGAGALGGGPSGGGPSFAYRFSDERSAQNTEPLLVCISSHLHLMIER